MEIWKKVEGFENYEVSNLGRVKSLYYNKEKILKQTIDGTGYFIVNLYGNGIRKVYKVHQLVAIVFLNHKPCGHKLVIDHIDSNELNNQLINLRIITNRENNSKERTIKSSSKFVGVSKVGNKWNSYIYINGKQKHLGRFTTEEEAASTYKKVLFALNK